MSNSGCPTHRKGAMKAAMELRAEDGELEARDASEPVEAATLRELAEKLTWKAMRVLEEDLAMSDPRARQEAARSLAAVGTKLLEKPPDPVPPQLTGEERIAAIVQAMTEPDAEMREAMRRVEERKASSG